MQELIDKLTAEAGLTPEQAQKAIETIAGFVKEKFPMLGGAVDNIFGSN
jgi:nucleoid DNA-binding protein